MNILIKLEAQLAFSYSTYCHKFILHRKQISGPRSRSAALERSHAQAAIDFEAAPAEQLVLEDEAHRVRDLLGLPEPPERYGRGHPRERFGLHALDHRGTNETGCEDRKSTRLNSSHTVISYAVFCLKKKKKKKCIEENNII